MSALRVGVLADALVDGGGIARYTTELVRGLGARDDVELVVVTAPELLDTARALAPGAEAVVAVGGWGQIGRALWERERLGAVLARHGVEVIHGTKHLLPRTALPTVLTAHDVTVLHAPEQYPWAKRWFLPRQYRAALQRATLIVAVSETTRRRVVDELPERANAVVVVPNGIGPALTEVEARPVTALTARPFALAVGDLSPRKNVGLLLDVWEEVHAATGLVLALVGPEGWRSAATARRADDLAARGLVVRVGRISDGELRWCYEHARVVLYPSLEEGYGLPVAEALVLGATVIASTDDALVEVSQGRATHVDARDHAGWLAAIRQVVDAQVVDGEMVDGEADRLSAEVAPAFAMASWSSTVAGTVAVYRDAIRRARRVS